MMRWGFEDLMSQGVLRELEELGSRGVGGYGSKIRQLLPSFDFQLYLHVGQVIEESLSPIRVRVPF
jgi:hypothetical protein